MRRKDAACEWHEIHSKASRRRIRGIWFAWAGVVRPDGSHYFRIQSPPFLVENDITQNGGNRVHSVWPDFKDDFGADLPGERDRAALAGHGHTPPKKPAK